MTNQTNQSNPDRQSLSEKRSWSRSYSTRVKGVEPEKIWKVWTDIDHWHTWQSDIEYAKLEGEFKPGSTFTLKPVKGPKVKIRLHRVEPLRNFTDLTRFPGARMYGSHDFICHGDELEIKTTIELEGFMSFLWRKIVAEDIVKSLPEQTKNLIARAGG